MNQSDKIYIAGHTGMVGSAIVRKLTHDGYNNLLTISSKDLDLRNQERVMAFFDKHKPDYVFLAAARVGGILANKSTKAEFYYDNIMIQSNVINASHRHGVKKLLFLGSSCIYPRDIDIPISEDMLMSGPLEQTNDAYAVAKIAGIKMCQDYREQYGSDFICAMPCNLYGPNDNYDPDTSHVFASLIKKFHDAITNKDPKVTIWGSGRPKREFMHVDDAADACVFLMNNYSAQEIVNIGTGEDIAIKDLAILMKIITKFEGVVINNAHMPDGVYRKVMNVDKIHSLGWRHKTDIITGIQITLEEYAKTH